MNKIPPCAICGTEFDNIFDATDHLLEDDGEDVFDPKLILPNGYSLLIGSLLRCLYKYADNPTQIESITQSTYATLFAAESNPSEMRLIVEDMIINEHMTDIDKELRELLAEEETDDGK
jgi:hypothetical protein